MDVHSLVKCSEEAMQNEFNTIERYPCSTCGKGSDFMVFYGNVDNPLAVSFACEQHLAKNMFTSGSTVVLVSEYHPSEG